jgi:secernin
VTAPVTVAAPQPRPWSCDTFVALPDTTAGGSTLLGKNSDRPAGECQPLRYWPRRHTTPGTRLHLAYIGIPDVREAWAHLGASPYWCWGHELGLNEWGVAIGNEALFTRDLADQVSRTRGGESLPRGVLGMEIVRLGLERATTAEEAVSVITDLVGTYGQWGSGVAGRPIEEGAYDNSYLVADPRQAWLVETSGRQWVARAVRTGICAISNQPTIRTEWDRASHDLVDNAENAGWWPADADRPFDFARAYADPRTPLQASHVRLQRSRQLLAEAKRRGTIAFEQAARVLRDHYEGTFLDGPYFSPALPDLLTLCMHDSPAGFTWGNTASSAIMNLSGTDDHLPHLWWAAATPCTSVYLPVFPAAARVPAALALPAPPGTPQRPEDVAPAAFDAQSYWWQFQQLLDHVKGNSQAWTFNDRQRQVRQEFDPLQQRWAQELPAVERKAASLLRAGNEEGRDILAQFTQRCAQQALEACAKLTAEFPLVLHPTDT